ncbi:MAG: asparagine--tRNA ligase [Patescibacteria group bacterium]|nr:asparagine--tRNA ligase [Patescibacteria group bacterium]
MLVSEIYQNEKEYLNKDIAVSGWVRTVRSSSAVGFITLNDGTHFKNLQIVFDKNLNNFAEAIKITIGSAVAAAGKLVASPGAGQEFELQAKSIEVIGLAAADYPLQKKRHSFEFLRTIAHLRTRANTFLAVFRVRSIASFAFHKFFQEKGFVYIHSPIITGSDCEGAGEMFRVTALDYNNPPKIENNQIDYSQDFFGQESFLTVSGQLNAEAMCHAFRNVYTFGPTFRAEYSNTTRHAAEFWMLEPEIAFAGLDDDIKLAEDMLKFAINYIREKAPVEMEFFNKFIDKELNKRLDNIVNSDFARITYTEAIEILFKAKEKFEYPVKWGIDLQTEHERYLAEKIYQKPVFVTDYPKEIKAFYMRGNNDKKTVAAMDLLVPGVGEIIGGSQREERLDILEQKIKDFKLNKEDYSWYLDLRRYGGVKHAGFGLGFERFLMHITGMSNIRDVLPFPRAPKIIAF